MARFRKKPTSIEAIQYNVGIKIDGLYIYGDKRANRWPPTSWVDINGNKRQSREGIDAFLPTMDGWLHVSPGDYVIILNKWERLIRRKDDFEAKYELVPDEIEDVYLEKYLDYL